ncbi:rhomboid-related protein 2-like [Artemia franciscana]|uniref:rhomboid protease n=1 Tax=Artemia franciscana TaxID=6661 RepID=A0AA88HG22_ARTSF|nr:hypothetical protein QYM36_014018 [Artemia franciscana]KAK2708274.1 hypothetical protein QYM36_014018 [Artemia franciscana]
MYRPREEYELESRQGSGRSGRLYPDIQSEMDDELGRESLKWKEVFVRLDRNRDGRIALHELKDFVQASPEEFQSLGQDVIEEIFFLCDKDSNGYLDEHEFMTMVKDHVLRRRHPDLHRLLSFASKVVVPQKSRREAVNIKVEEFRCCPPPLLFILLSLVELGVFIYYAIECSNDGATLTAEGPVPILSPLIYNPRRRYEAWRYFSYMLIHSGYVHIISNIVVQILLGVPLEMFHGPLRLFVIYISGVIAGSLGTSVSDPRVYLAGASGGVYAVLTAHVSSIILNWNELEFAPIRLAAFLIFFCVDLGVAVYTRYTLPPGATKVGYVAHLAGAIAGLLVGINVLRNVSVNPWEKYCWWVCLFLYFILLGAAVAWNIAYADYFPPDDTQPLQPGHCRIY